jgi:uncharacterized membrane protein
MEQMSSQCIEMINRMMGDLTNGTIVNGMLQFWLLAVVGVALLMMAIRRDITTNTGAALNVLDERFARGEIDREEYESRERILRNRR